ncbi:MAG: radical SAM protein [Ruminococcus sp.]|nr:radical SAM protein [Ruminococcus sp.]
MPYSKILENCSLCPRKCGVNRYKSKGFCGEGSDIRIARAELHHWEEPCISGTNGSGAVFFSGCSLKCCFCQNYEISSEGKGFKVTKEELADVFLSLQEQNAYNINLVNPTHFVPQIISALNIAGNELKIPIVYNCGGYETPETLEILKDNIDIFLPDLKYFDSGISKKYSSAEDYFEKASSAIRKMVEIAGKPKYDDNGMLRSGVIVRHMVLPGCRHDSQKLMEWLVHSFEKDEILVSVMSQYTPVYKAFNYKELSRRTSTFEYNYVCDLVEKSGFDGFFQHRTSAEECFIPDFYDYKYF